MFPIRRPVSLFAILLLPLLAGPAEAAPYPLGSMTCADIGKFASEVMAAKKAGRSRDDAVASLDQRQWGDEAVERKNLTDIIHILYGNLGRNLGVQSAGAVMKTDCETGR